MVRLTQEEIKMRQFELAENQNIVFSSDVKPEELNVRDDDKFVAKIIDGQLTLIKVTDFLEE